MKEIARLEKVKETDYELERERQHIREGSINLGKVSNKVFKRLLRGYRYIDVAVYYYDYNDRPNFNDWVDIEGVGYGFLWLYGEGHRGYKHKLLSGLRKMAVGWNTNNVYYYDDTEAGEKVFVIGDYYYYNEPDNYRYAVIRVSHEEIGKSK